MADYSSPYDRNTSNNYDIDSHHVDRPPIGPVMSYLKSAPGILRIVEMVITMIAFICASVFPYWTAFGGGWAQFVAMSAFIIVTVLFILTFLNVKPRVPIPWPLIEFIFYAVYSLFFLIAGIVAAVRSHWHSSIIASMVFLFASTGLFVAETFLLYRKWILSRHETHDTAATATITTTTTYSTREQY